jgi:hypothetical protein
VAIIEEFFISQEVCWTSPFARDSIRIPGWSEVISYYLVCSLKEAYEIFQKYYQPVLKKPSIRISKCLYGILSIRWQKSAKAEVSFRIESRNTPLALKRFRFERIPWRHFGIRIEGRFFYTGQVPPYGGSLYGSCTKVRTSVKQLNFLKVLSSPPTASHYPSPEQDWNPGPKGPKHKPPLCCWSCKSNVKQIKLASTYAQVCQFISSNC